MTADRLTEAEVEELERLWPLTDDTPRTGWPRTIAKLLSERAALLREREEMRKRVNELEARVEFLS